MQARHIPGLLSFERSGVAQTVFTPNLQKTVISNDLPPLWSQHSSKNLCQSDKLDCPSNEKQRYANFGSARRFSSCTPGPRNSFKPCEPARKDNAIFGLANKFRKIYFNTKEISGLPRNTMGPLVKPQAFANREIAPIAGQDSQHFKFGENESKTAAESHRVLKLREFCCKKREIALSNFVKISKYLTTGQLCQDVYCARRCFKRPTMVVSESATSFSATPSTRDTFHYDRRIRFRVGRSDGQSLPLGNVVREREKLSLQREGNARNIKSISNSCSLSKPIYCHCPMRQSYGCSVSSPRRGNQILPIDGHNIHSAELDRSVPHSYKHTLYSGAVQQPCRPFISFSPGSRMAPAARSNRKDIFEMGNTTSRLVCLQKHLRSSSLCDERSERPVCSGTRRILNSLEIRPSMGVSSSISIAQSSELPQPGVRSLSDSGPKMGESILARGPESQGFGTSIHNTEPEQSTNRCDNGSTTPSCSGPRVGSMEMWGWTRELQNWNDSQIELLKGSWRASTLKTYKPTWNRWVAWCNDYNLNPSNPSGSDLARYLADLYIKHKFSYNTIMLHKSVVSTLCTVNNSSSLSSHPLVKHVLKSISLKKPTVFKSAVWNVDKFVSFLSNRTINHSNIFDVSSHTAALLVICSGRRIHDLTLLMIDDDNYVRSLDPNYVILWPAFGSKTDSANYRQSGWKLFKNTDNINLDPVYWIERTFILLSARREEAKCQNLFITTRGTARAASRTVIAGWIKNLMRQADIEATPGSIRSAVASKNWLDNFPLDEILARGNWRSSNTFAKFYKRQVMDSSRSNGIGSLFVPTV